ncbi:MAG TPA: DNA replication/repair protein RecF [Acidimicrobiia bacterium]
MHLTTLALTEFRCYPEAEVTFPPAVTVVTGANGQGKTSLLEAIGWLALGRSFRGVPDAALVRDHAERAIVRGSVVHDTSVRRVDVELRATGRHRILLNGHPAARIRDLLGSLRVTVFAPDDLQLVKSGPAQRRDYLDDLLVAAVPRYAAVRGDFDRVLRHRNALLRGGTHDAEARATLAVFDEQLVTIGGELTRGRLRVVARLAPMVDVAYRALAHDAHGVTARYEPGWDPSERDLVPDDVEHRLRDALARTGAQEQARGVTLVGPHRDEWRLTIDRRDSRTHASQGEQRSLALALRLAAHRVVTEVIGSEPVLLLDDVFSELDADRSRALVAALPPEAQTVITTASSVPSGIHPAARLDVGRGQIVAAPEPS